MSIIRYTCGGYLGFLAMILCSAELANAQPSGAPTPEIRAAAAPGTSGQSSLGGSSSLAVAEQVCFIAHGGTVTCNNDGWIHKWYSKTGKVQGRRIAPDDDDLDDGTPLSDPKNTEWHKVPGLRDVVALSAGHGFICALTRQGSVKCWGDDPRTESDGEEKSSLGLFGDGKHRHYVRPQALNRVPQRVVAIAAQARSLCVRFADGKVQCINDYYLNRRHPKDGGRQLHTLSIVDGGACLLDNLGKVACMACAENSGCSGWAESKGFAGPVQKMTITCGGECIPQVIGLTRRGQLQLCQLSGDSKRCPELPLVPADVAQLYGSCARTTRGEVYCWGGRPRKDAPIRTQRIALPEPATELSVGTSAVCMRLTSGKIACLGWNPLFGRITAPLTIFTVPQVR